MRSIFYSLALLAPSIAVAAVPQTVTCNVEAAHHLVTEARQSSFDTEVLPTRTSELKKLSGSDIITTIPEGAKHEVFNRVGQGWFMYLIYTRQSSFEYYGMDIYTMEDGTVYMKSPVSSFYSGSYVEGYMDGDKMTFEFPQSVWYAINEYTGEYKYHAVMLDYKATSATQGTYIQSDNQTLTFSRTAEGGWKADGLTNGARAIGLVDHEGNWFGYCDYNLEFKPFEGELLTPPAGLQTEDWVMKYSGTGHKIKVGFEGDNIWIQGIYHLCPEAWITGTVGKTFVKLPGGQYLGTDDSEYYHNYFFGASKDVGTDPISGRTAYVFPVMDEIRMDYDPANKYITTDMQLVANYHPTKSICHDVYWQPELTWQSSFILPTPKKIEVNDYFLYDESEGVGGIDFNYNQYNIYDELLDTDHLFYRVMVDEDYLEVDPADYTATSVTMTDIPYWYCDFRDIFGRRVQKEFYFFVRDMDYLGIRPVYIDDNGKEWFGPHTNIYGVCPEKWYTEDLPDSIEKYLEEKASICEDYYTNMYGVRVANPEKGLYIHTVKYNDGSVKSTKVAK